MQIIKSLLASFAITVLLLAAISIDTQVADAKPPLCSLVCMPWPCGTMEDCPGPYVACKDSEGYWTDCCTWCPEY